MLRKSQPCQSFQQKLKSVDETIARYKENRANMIIEHEKRQIERKMEMTRVKGLQIQAQQNYIVGYSGMRKKELILKLDKRINDEIILTLPKVMFNNIFNYLTLNDKVNMTNVSKDMKNRSRASYTKLEKLQIKFPKDYMSKMIEELMNISNIRSNKNKKRFVELSNKITNDFDIFYPPHSILNEYSSRVVQIIVKLIKQYLNLCQTSNVKREKVLIALALMKLVTDREMFINQHVKFAFTVKAKMEEFDSETFTPQERREMDIYKEKIINFTNNLPTPPISTIE